MSLCHDWGYFPLAWCWPFACWAPQCKYSEALMQKCRPCSLSHSLSPTTHTQPLSLTDFMDVHCLTFSPCWIPPPLPLPVLSSSLPSFFSHLSFSLSLSAVFCPTSLHAWPALLWLLTSKSYFIHQSLISEREPFSTELKEREGTRSECIKKKEGERVYEKRARERKRIRSWPQGTSGITKAKKGTHSHTSTHPYSLSQHSHTCTPFCFCPVGCVQMLHTWSLPSFSVYPSSLYLVFPSFFSLEPAVQRGVEACSFP